MTDPEIITRLARIESLLERLIIPVAAEEARQLASATDEQRREHNKAVMQRAKARQRRAA